MREGRLEGLFYPLLIILGTTILFYGGILHIAHNGDFWHHTWYGQSWGFKKFSMIKFPRPMPLIVFLANYKLFGLNPVPLHLLTLFLHTLTALFTFGLVKKLTGDVFVSLFAALFFIALFIHAEVIFCTGFVYEPIWAFFAIVTIVTFYFYLERGGALLYSLSLFSFLLTLLSKEGSVTLPCVLLTIACYHKLGRLQPREVKNYIIQRETVKTFLPFFLMSGAYLYLTAQLVPVFSYGHHEFWQLSSVRHKVEMPLHLLIFAFTPCFVYNNVVTEILGLVTILFVGVVYYYSDNEYRKKLAFLAICLFFIQFPSYYKAGVHARYLYFPSVFGMSMVVLSIMQGVTILLPKLQQRRYIFLSNSTAIILTLYLVSLGLNYNFMRDQDRVWKYAGKIIETNIQDVVNFFPKGLQEEQIIFVNMPAYFYSPLPFMPITVWGGINYPQMAIDLHYGAFLNFDHAGLDLGLKLPFLMEYELAKGVKLLTTEEFNTTSEKFKNSGNSILLYNPFTRHLADITGRSYSEVRDFLRNAEKESHGS